MTVEPKVQGVSSEDGGRGHNPRNADGLEKLEKVMKWFLS